MKRTALRISRSGRTSIRSFYNSSNLQSLPSLPHVEIISAGINTIPTSTFQNRAFIPETPLHISPPSKEAFDALPAIKKWFIHEKGGGGVGENISPRQDAGEDHSYPIPNLAYLSQFQDTILPYEYFSSNPSSEPSNSQDTIQFHTLHAPLQLLLQAATTPTPTPTPTSSKPAPAPSGLYIAQAQLISLPAPLQHDLPTPALIHAAGRGDIYDSNLWLGIPPTHTPLHKDPNPNFFVQLAGRKQVRLYRPSVGERMFWEVKKRIAATASNGNGVGGGSGSGSGSPSIRGPEMFVGAERRELEAVVWGEMCEREGVECVVGVGEALFIPKGWWHSIRSVGYGTNGSVNWWFR